MMEILKSLLPSRCRGRAFVLLLVCSVPHCASAETAELTLSGCLKSFEANPDDWPNAYCFYQVTRHQHDEQTPKLVRQTLESLLEDYIENSHVPLVLAYLENNPGRRKNLYGLALERYRALNDLTGELRTRYSFTQFLTRQNQFSEAEEQLAAMEALRERTDHPLHLARIDIARARYLFDVENDFARVWQILKKHEVPLSQQDSYWHRQQCLSLLGQSAYELGKLGTAQEYFERAARLAHESGEVVDELSALRNALWSLREQLEESSSTEGAQAMIARTQRVLEQARAVGYLPTLTGALLLLGDLYRDPRSIPLYQECLERTAGVPELLYAHKTCYLTLAAHIADASPERALEMVADLWEKIPEVESLASLAYDQMNEVRVFWRAAPFEKARDESFKALDAIEDLRAAQPEGEGRAESFSSWAMTYPWVSGQLLKHYEMTGKRTVLDDALLVMERMRARLLLEILDTRSATPPETEELRTAREQLARNLQKRNQLQRQLRIGQLPAQDQRSVATLIDKMIEEEGHLRGDIARLSGRFSSLEAPDFADINSLQSALQDHEALFSFQLAPWESVVEAFGGGSWLIATTRNQVNAYRMPDSDEIRDRVDMFTRLLERGKPGQRLASRLHEDLLAKALEDLPPEITDLIVIPDKALHRLPFAALRPSKDAPPLATRYRFSRVPSATLWLRRWREPGPPSVAPQPALVLADPGTFESADAGGSQIASLMRDGDPFRAESYGPLPFARQEGWSLLRQLGPGTEVLTGFEASERFLKTAENLDRFGILHFAAHAVANEEEPDRAGIFLAPDLPGNGAPAELDGVLQFNEIVDLGFNDRTVVLSTCHSARGQILRGEGVFDLARAFFEGGARAVVGSLWRLEDQATALFFDDFYRHLARGISLSEALHRAQKDQIDRGAPPSVWAGIVVIGDGSLVPVPSRGGRHHPAWPIGLAAVLLLVAVAVAARRSP